MPAKHNNINFFNINLLVDPCKLATCLKHGDD